MGTHVLSLPARGVLGEARQASFPARGPTSPPQNRSCCSGERCPGWYRAEEREAVSRGRGVRGRSGRAPALPGRRPPAWRSPPGAPESPLSAEERRRDTPGARRLRVAGGRVPQPPGSRPQEFGLLSVPTGFPFPLRTYPGLCGDPFHWEPVL